MNHFNHHDYNQTHTPYGISSPQSFINKVFGWMAVGLGLTAGVAYYVSPYQNPDLFMSLMRGPLWILFIVQIGLVLSFQTQWQNLSFGASLGILGLYATLNGVVLAPLAYVYTASSLMQTFLTASLMFGIMALYGAVTKYDLSKIRHIISMALLGMLISLVVNMFLKSPTFEVALSVIGVLLFSVLTAYRMQEIRHASMQNLPQDVHNKLALIHALGLYLALINIFLYLLRFMGRRR